MQNRPSREELLRGVIRFLREEAVEQLEGRAKFHARVAARAADMVLRELSTERATLRGELESLRELLEETGQGQAASVDPAAEVERLNRELVRRIQAGELDAGSRRNAVLLHLKKTTVTRLEVNNPKMAEVVRRDFGLPPSPSS